MKIDFDIESIKLGLLSGILHAMIDFYFEDNIDHESSFDKEEMFQVVGKFVLDHLCFKVDCPLDKSRVSMIVQVVHGILCNRLEITDPITLSIYKGGMHVCSYTSPFQNNEKEPTH